MLSPLARLGCAKCAILLHIANRNIQGYTLIPELSGSACWFSSYPCQTEVMFENFADFHTAESRVSFTGNTAEWVTVVGMPYMVIL